MKDTIKNKMLELKDKKVKIIINEGRSKKRKVDGYIRGIYKNTFVIDINNIWESFSYSDIICNKVVIKRL